MVKRDCEELLDSRDFVEIAEIKYGLPFKVYWHPGRRFELQLAKLVDQYMVKGLKKYYIKGVSKKGKKTWDRNLGRLMDKLRASFPEFHLYVAGLSNLPADMSPEGKESKNEAGRLREIQEDIRQLRKRLRRLSSVESSGELVGTDLLERVVETKEQEIRKDLQDLAEKREQLKESIEEKHELVEEYREKGSALCYVMACSTQLRVGREDQLKVILEETIKDIETAHHYGGFTQSLKRGLNIYHEEVKFPWLTHQAEFVGISSPDLLEGYPALKEQAQSFFMVTASQDLKIDGKTKRKGKKTPARVMKAFLDRVGTLSESQQSKSKEVPTEGGWIGNLMEGDKLTETPFLFDLDKLNHGYISGTTGSGKTFTARALAENAIVNGVDVVVLDSTRQWCGLAKPASETKERLRKLGVDRDLATGFPVDIYTPNSSSGKKLPENLSQLADGVSVVTLKGLYDEERCEIARDILSDIYMSIDRESEKLEVLVVIEEAHTLLPGNVNQSAKEVAKECAEGIERISREARKYGLNLLLISQSLSDFRRSSKTVREMMNSKFFMRATDRSEISYVEDYVSKEAADWVKNLDVGEVIVNSPGVGPAKVYVRPPFSQVGELSDSEIEEATQAQEEKFTEVDKEDFLAKIAALKEGAPKASTQLSKREERLLEVAEDHLQEEEEPIHVSKVQEELGIKNKRELQKLIDQMEEKGLIETEKLEKRGTPRGIIPR